MDRENPTTQFSGGGAANRSRCVPQEIIEEILTLLPVKSLLRFKCVSKSWLRLIGSDRFIQIHLQTSRDYRTSAHQRVIFTRNTEPEPVLVQCSMRYLMEKSSLRPPIEDPTNNYRPLSGSIVDSCNGVLCILRKEFGSFILFNPSTRIFLRLPELNRNRAIDIYGFGWDETNDAYKVFVVMSERFNNISRRVYSTKTNSWKTVQHGERKAPFSVDSRRGKFACGKIHWLTMDHDPRIVSFDLKSEVFGMIELPFKRVMPPMRVHAWLAETKEGCLAVYTYKDRFTLDWWIMKEYGVKESWVVKESRLEWHVYITTGDKVHFYRESLVSPVSDKHLQQTEERMLQGKRDTASKLLPGFSKFFEKLKHKKN